MEQKIHELEEKIRTLSCGAVPQLVAIDGRCAAGKTTLANELQKRLGCTVFHMDDFFLQPWQRTKERLDTPGGNVDYERFYEEILVPLGNGVQEVSYRSYDCRAQQLSQPITVKPKQTVLVEGSYSCHPKLWDFYSMHIFLTVDSQEQLRRIAKRGGAESVRQFRERWIPLEERYFEVYRIMERCEYSFAPNINII